MGLLQMLLDDRLSGLGVDSPENSLWTREGLLSLELQVLSIEVQRESGDIFRCRGGSERKSAGRAMLRGTVASWAKMTDFDAGLDFWTIIWNFTESS